MPIPLRTVDSTSRKGTDGGVYDRIRADVLSLNLAPGSDIDEKTLATAYGVSRTPIREALIRLSADGLIAFSPSRGARVTSLIVQGFPRYLEAIDLSQRALARIGALRALPDDKDQLAAANARFRDSIAQLDFPVYETVVVTADAEADVLTAIGRCAHNSYLFEAFEKLLLQGQRMLRLPYAYNPAGAVTVEEYAADRLQSYGDIATAIATGDGNRAEEEMRTLHHARTQRLTAYMVENLATDISVELSETNGQQANQ